MSCDIGNMLPDSGGNLGGGGGGASGSGTAEMFTKWADASGTLEDSGWIEVSDRDLVNEAADFYIANSTGRANEYIRFLSSGDRIFINSNNINTITSTSSGTQGIAEFRNQVQVYPVSGNSATVAIFNDASSNFSQIKAVNVTGNVVAQLPNMADATLAAWTTKQTAALTADDTAITVTASNILLTSDNATSTNRTFTLATTGAVEGQKLTLRFSDGTNACEIVASANNLLIGGTTITFNAVGQRVEFEFNEGKWEQATALVAVA